MSLSLWLCRHILKNLCLLCHCHSNRILPLCQDCEDELPWLTNGCAICSNLLPTGALICGTCLSMPPAYQKVHALFVYQQPITTFTHQLKFNEELVYAKVFALLLTSAIKKYYCHEQKPQYIIPMPLHNARLRRRGYNQALEIAKRVSKQLNIPMANKNFIRHKATLAQSELGYSARQSNIKDVFKIKQALKARYVVIIDDVMTTGATVNELTKTIRQSGIERVDVWCIARTMQQ